MLYYRYIMETTINLSAFDKTTGDNRDIPVDDQTLQTFAAQNNFTFAAETPYNSQALGRVVMAAKSPVMRNVIAGRLHDLPIQVFQRFCVHVGSGQYKMSQY